MSIRWAPPEAILARTLNADDVTLEVESDAGFEDYNAPFDIVAGLEMLTVTARAGAVWSVDRPVRGSALAVHYGGSKITALPHTIVLTKGETVWDYTAIARNLHHREESPGGEIEASWEFDTAHPEDWLPEPEAQLLLSHDLETPGTFVPYFGGIVGRISCEKKDATSYHVTIAARGYWTTLAWDGFDGSHVYPAETAGYQVIEDALGVHAPWIASDDFYIVDGGQSIPQDLEVIGKSVRQIVDDICAAGDVGEPLDRYVRTDTDGAPKFHLLRRSRQPVIRIPWESIQPIKLAWDTELQRTKVFLKWRDGWLPKTAVGATVTRWKPVDVSTQVDNLDFAVQIANQVLAETADLHALSDGGVVLEWPKPVYDDDDNEIVPFTIRAGWLVEFTDVDPWLPSLPIGQMQIKALDCDHAHYKVALTLGPVIEDDLTQASGFVAKESKLLGNAVNSLIPQNITPPEGVPQGVSSQAVSAGASGSKIGYKKLADDADYSTIWVSIDGGGSVIATGRKPDIPIDVRMLVRGFRLVANDGDPTSPGPGTINLTIGHGTTADLPGAGTTVGTIGVTSGDYRASKDLDEDEDADEHVVQVEPTDYLSVTVEDDIDSIGYASLGILVQRLEGSSRPAGATPIIVSVSATRDGSNVTTFTVTTDRFCTLQIEYGETTDYGSRSYRTEINQRESTLQVKGLPATTHYRAHVWDVDENETIGTDQTV